MGGGKRVLIVGGGGKTHALGEALRASPSVERVVFAPGTSGLERCGYETAPVASQDLAGLVELAEMEEFDLTVVGPNTPLVDGIVDRFEEAGLPIFGPGRAAARLEGSKVYARLLMGRLGVPTPRFAVCDTMARALHLAHTRSWARVFKADGVAYDKGVRVTAHASEAERALEEVLLDNVYGLESERFVVEERIDGVEATVWALCDGADVAVMGHVLNYPRLFEGDAGPPTRGLGQVSPAPASVLDAAGVEAVVARAVRPVVEDLAAGGTPLRGALFVDLMMVKGEPYIIDYNVRFGEPATQTMLSGYRGDVYAALEATRRADRGMAAAVGRLERDERPRVSVVAVCEGYPRPVVRGARITYRAEVFEEGRGDVWVYWDGVRATEDGALWTTGGRAFTVVAAGATVQEARERAYGALDAGVAFEGMHVRRDIGRGW